MTEGLYDIEHITTGLRHVVMVSNGQVWFHGSEDCIGAEAFKGTNAYKILRGPYEISDPSEAVTIPHGIWDGGFDEHGQNADPATSLYRTRLATPNDEPMANHWTDNDLDHRGRMTGKFWTDQQGCQSRLLYKGDRPQFFFRLEHIVRIHIQFPPALHTDQGELRGALLSGMRWLESVLASTGARELVFDSTARLLRRFVVGALGFTAEPNTLSRSLVPPPSEAATSRPR